MSSAVWRWGVLPAWSGHFVIYDPGAGKLAYPVLMAAMVAIRRRKCQVGATAGLGFVCRCLSSVPCFWRISAPSFNNISPGARLPGNAPLPSGFSVWVVPTAVPSYPV